MDRRLTLSGSPGRDSLDRGSIFFVGTATTLIRYGGFTILTDPNFLHAGDHVHLGYVRYLHHGESEFVVSGAARAAVQGR